MIRVLTITKRAQLTALVAQIERYPEAIDRVVSKAWLRVVWLDSVSPHTAMLLKQELLALDGDALIDSNVYLGTANTPTPILAWASERAWRTFERKMALMPIAELQQLGQAVHAALDAVDRSDRGCLSVAGRTWRWGERTLVMGIVNVTPDSFSADGLADDLTKIADQAREFASVGADILDVGGESTRPGASMISDDEEIQRVVPAIRAIRHVTDLPISIDSYKAEVVRHALDAGANIINDIWGLRTADGDWNHELAQLAAERDVPIVLMHNRRAKTASFAHGHHFTDTQYQDLVAEVCADLQHSIDFGLHHGIKHEQIMLDPGLGFGKNPTQNMEFMRRMDELKSLGYPLLIGTSRKSFIGLTLNKPVDQRVFGTAATVAHAIMHGADIVRVHDVAAMVDVCRMTDALVRMKNDEGRK